MTSGKLFKYLELDTLSRIDRDLEAAHYAESIKLDYERKPAALKFIKKMLKRVRARYRECAAGEYR